LRKASAWEDAKTYEKRLALLTRTQITLATKLRLSVQAGIRWDETGKRGERGAAPQVAPDPLLGGRAVWGDQRKPN
jgi:hypothetical protein